jgi:GntR family transcriptional repressor for pyruvate dehydrogenase complex
MSKGAPESAMRAAATLLRTVILEKQDGDFLGDEREVIQILGVSRTTLRQIARLLEREGLLAVKRGANGGYYARRPNVSSVEAAVIDYLEILEIRTDELSTMASIIWIEAIRQACELKTPKAVSLTRKLSKIVRATGDDLSYGELLSVEQIIRSDVFALIESPYVKFIFQINVQFGQKRLGEETSEKSVTHIEAEFIRAWRDVKLLELSSIGHGDPELGTIAAQRTRNLWRQVSQFQLPVEPKARRGR